MTAYDRPTLQLLDANANRAREGVRTAEDYLRFVLRNQVHAAALKRIRAAITATLQAHFSHEELLAARGVAADPLNPDAFPPVNPTAAEDARAVAQRGLKRAQEAVRVLEEYLRAPQPAAAAKFAGLRYELYELEQWLVRVGPSAAILAAANLYVLLTGKICSGPILKTAEAVLKGGAKLLQLREKELSDKVLLQQAHDLHKLSIEHNAVLICNDRIDLALLACIEGIHLGQDDVTPFQARQLGARNLLIGRSTHSVEQARTAVDSDRVDYIAIGSMYETATKPGRTLAGLQLAEKVSALELPVPVFGIGGITVQRVAELKQAGISRVAVSSAIISSPDPEGETRRFIEALAK